MNLPIEWCAGISAAVLPRRASVKNHHEKGIALVTAILVLLLTSTMIVGLAWLTMTDQKLGGNNNDRQLAFYGAESGMETLTARLENEFNSNYAPSATDINNLVLNPPTNVPGVQYLAPGSTTNGSGFTIAFNKNAQNNPQAANGTITTGQFSGLVSLNTPYTLTVTAHTSYGSEVKLQRVVQTVGIPVFEFGVFCQYDCAFFSGTNFTMGGRVATNGNLWLQELSGKTLTINGKTTAAGEIVTASLENGGSVTGYGGAVDIQNPTAGTTPNLIGQTPAQSISQTQAWNSNSLTAAENPAPGTYTYNAGFSTVASSTYGGYVGVKETGVKPLNLSIATSGVGGQPIDLIRQPAPGETTSSAIYGERFFGNQQTSIRILLTDYGTDGTCSTSVLNSSSSSALPGLTTTAPVDLATLAWDTSATTFHANDGAHPPPYNAAPSGITAGNIGSSVFPLPVSFASSAASPPSYTSSDGYWVQKWYPTITGCLKIEYQDTSNVWHDVTWTILNLGYTGRNINPQVSAGYAGPPTEPALPASAVNSQGPTVKTGVTTVGCTDPSANAVIRLARVRDNPSFTGTGGCGTPYSTSTTQHGYDFWPNVLFDAREGMLNQQNPAPLPTNPTLAGAMYYVELDAGNLAKCLNGTIAACSGQFTSIQNTNGYAIYFSDRRSEQKDPNPPASVLGSNTLPAGGMLTGGYGYDNFVNPASGYACPNSTLDVGEDPESDYVNGISTNTATTARTYGNILNPLSPPPGLWPTSNLGNTLTYPSKAYTQLYATVGTTPSGTAVGSLESAVLTNYPFNSCSMGLTWPFAAANKPNEVRENPPIFFRRALKIVDGYNLPMSTCTDVLAVGKAVNCGGLSIASENPVYVQGDFNNDPTKDATLGTPYSADTHAAASIIADAVTLLSDNWNDVNSIAFPYDSTKRAPVQTTYRMAIMGGKQVVFPLPTYTSPASPPADAGTDGGIHNFLRYLEDWATPSQITSYYLGSMVGMYYNHQALGIYKYSPTALIVYDAPGRNYKFDHDFLTPSLLPPETPMLRDVNAIGFTQMILPTQ
jgi:hypothetical protein